MSIGRATLAVWFLVVSGSPVLAHAQTDEAKGTSKADRATAREAYDKGTAAFEKGDFVTALDSFVKANALIPSVQAMYWIAQAQDRLGRTDAAIEAYEAVTSRADFSKLSEDKASVVRERLAALKASIAPAPVEPATPSSEAVPPPDTELPPPQPAPEPTPVPPSEPPPLPVTSSDYWPKKNTAELGLMGGAMWVSPSHNLVEAGREQREFDAPAWQIGLRAAFFPERVFGVEAEWAHGFGQVKALDFVNGGSAGSANFDVVRGHLIGQIPTSRLVPFALLGAGIMRGSSDEMGADTDFLLQAGLGLKVMATKLLVPRLDIRAGFTQQEGGGFTDGIAVHPEVLLGLSFTLGR
jgi:hypothetical protein